MEHAVDHTDLGQVGAKWPESFVVVSLFLVFSFGLSLSQHRCKTTLVQAGLNEFPSPNSKGPRSKHPGSLDKSDDDVT